MSGVGGLLLRMVVSLAIVLAFVFVAYHVARRRQSGASLNTLLRRNTRPATVARLEVEARTGLARGSAAVAVRFGDRIVLVGVNDGAPSSVLAEVPAHQWDAQAELPALDEATDRRDVRPVRSPFGTGTASLHDLLVPSGRSAKHTPFDPNGIVSQRPTFVEALRTATSRRP